MAAAPPPFRPGNPAVCGSRPLVTSYYCRLGDLLCFVFMSAYCIFDCVGGNVKHCSIQSNRVCPLWAHARSVACVDKVVPSSLVVKKSLQTVLVVVYKSISFSVFVDVWFNDVNMQLSCLSRFSLRYVWRWISRKPLEIEVRLQRTINRKWHMGYRMVTWPMTSRDLERSISWVVTPIRLERNISTRSQAVARIADRTAKNCRGHVT